MLTIPRLTLERVFPDPQLAMHLKEGSIHEIRSNGASSLVFVSTFDMGMGQYSSFYAQYLNTNYSLDRNLFLWKTFMIQDSFGIVNEEKKGMSRSGWFNQLTLCCTKPKCLFPTPWNGMPSKWTSLSQKAQQDVMHAFKFSR